MPAIGTDCIIECRRRGNGKTRNAVQSKTHFELNLGCAIRLFTVNTVISMMSRAGSVNLKCAVTAEFKSSDVTILLRVLEPRRRAKLRVTRICLPSCRLRQSESDSSASRYVVRFSPTRSWARTFLCFEPHLFPLASVQKRKLEIKSHSLLLFTSNKYTSTSYQA